MAVSNLISGQQQGGQRTPRAVVNSSGGIASCGVPATPRREIIRGGHAEFRTSISISYATVAPLETE